MKTTAEERISELAVLSDTIRNLTYNCSPKRKEMQPEKYMKRYGPIWR